MLPQANENTLPAKRTIFINPNFAAMTQSNHEQTSGKVSTHVNPLFLRQRQQTEPIAQIQPKQQIHMNPQFIHMNPLFYQKKLIEHHQQLQLQHLQQQQQQKYMRANDVQCQHITPNTQQKTLNAEQNKPVAAPSSVELSSVNASAAATAPLLHLSKRKLIRCTAKTNTPNDNVPVRTVHPVMTTKANVKLNAPSSKLRYKLDRRKPPTAASPLRATPKATIQSQFIVKQRKLIRRLPVVRLKLTKAANSPTASPNKKLKLVSINNILYKSTQNKLQRSDAANKNIALRTKLLATIAAHKRSMSTQQTRTYLHNVKQRSVMQLSKHYKKTNDPCPVYQRLGKCAAHERGRCNKNHDKQQVIVCPKLLRGECFDSNCLLSHNISLAKMPVCKFYLQGLCVRNNCPYLHKKLNETVEVCTDFLRGFCQLAEKNAWCKYLKSVRKKAELHAEDNPHQGPPKTASKLEIFIEIYNTLLENRRFRDGSIISAPGILMSNCDKRHEFQCPELALKKKCTLQSCVYCKQTNRRKATKSKVVNISKQLKSKQQPALPDALPTVEAVKQSTDDEESPVVKRYFAGNDKETPTAVTTIAETMPAAGDEVTNETSTTVGAVFRQNRPKIGILPAFIPLS